MIVREEGRGQVEDLCLCGFVTSAVVLISTGRSIHPNGQVQNDLQRMC